MLLRRRESQAFLYRKLFVIISEVRAGVRRQQRRQDYQQHLMFETQDTCGMLCYTAFRINRDIDCTAARATFKHFFASLLGIQSANQPSLPRIFARKNSFRKEKRFSLIKHRSKIK